MRTHFFFVLLALAMTTAACKKENDSPPAENEPKAEAPISRDWDLIKERDTLTVLTTFNSTSYFIYRGEPMGFEYELLKEFAKENGVELRTIVVRNLDSLFTLLNRGVGDVAAARLTPASADTERVALTKPLYRTRPVTVQRTGPLERANLPEGVDTVITEGPETGERAPEDEPGPGAPPGSSYTLRARLISSPEQLAGREVHVGRRTAVYDRLVELSNHLTGDIEIVEVEGQVSPEGLMRQVAEGEIELTATEENLALLTASRFDNLVVRPALGKPIEVVFAVRRNAPQLREKLNEWISNEKLGGLVEALYEKYYVDRRRYRERVASEYLTSETGKLCDYDELIKANAGKIGWDWRLLASQMYQESRFDPDAQSWAGATGLLQLMPATARQYGVTDLRDPQQNVEGAVRFLEFLIGYWAERIPEEDEQLRFVLASYNAGHGHVEDARRLTQKHGGDPNNWDDVAYWMLQLSKQQYYTDPVVRYGFVRGLEPVTYVALILDRFDHYKHFVTEPPPKPAPRSASV